jgi:hypothetical protein
MINKLLKNSPVLEAIQGFVPRASRRRQGFKVPRATKIHNLYKIEFDGFRQKTGRFSKIGPAGSAGFQRQFFKTTPGGRISKTAPQRIQFIALPLPSCRLLKFPPSAAEFPSRNFLGSRASLVAIPPSPARASPGDSPGALVSAEAGRRELRCPPTQRSRVLNPSLRLPLARGVLSLLLHPAGWFCM